MNKERSTEEVYVTCLLDAEDVASLDALAAQLQSDRSALLREAVMNFITQQRRQNPDRTYSLAEIEAEVNAKARDLEDSGG